MTGQPVRRNMTPDELWLAGGQLFGESPGRQSRLAEVLGYDRSAVSRWLSGATPIPIHASLLVRYMLIFGLPVEDTEPAEMSSD